ncbi:MAG TPA: N-6 DNA methylase [Ktedonobacteraceae bacterium]|nr:N-6 DNA methylase [Ktedonobacteraceae bacterium]
MNTIDLQNMLLEELDFGDAPGFQPEVSWPNDRPIPHISSAYFIQGNPVVYFSQLEEVNTATLAQLYRSVWSQGKAPLLYVISRQDILVFNGYEGPPPRDNPDEILSNDEAHQHRLLHHLQSLYDIETARQEIANNLRDYRRILLDTGAFWQTEDGKQINREKRADQRLLDAMGDLRKKLLESNLPSDVAYALLGRSIFIRYLEDRGLLTETLVAQITNGLAQNYLTALDNKKLTYDLFDYLHRRFNGDIFPVDEQEKQAVSKKHLELLQSFLQGTNLKTGQLSFWPYDFSCVPIELISGIYDTFLSTRKELGAYYTPLPLVDFIVEETLPLEKITPEMTILDPACGSGVFLVRVYQRLIEAWKQHNPGHPSASQLTALMQQSLFGVDVKLNAVRIAAFSLCLSMLDYLKNDEIIQDNFRFPRMEKANLIRANFFSKKVDSIFSGKRFDKIVGNPPWGDKTLKGLALKWVTKEDFPTGDNQLAQAFLYRAPHFCAEHGEVAMLAPTKSTIIVGSDTHQKFRQKFFAMYHVRAVVNFSALVYELFPDSLSPSVALFYQPEQPTEQGKIVYATPKPSSVSQSLGAIVLDKADIKFLEREELRSNPALWKIALWGNPRDTGLIERLQSLPQLEHLEKTGQLREEIREGFIVGNRKKEAFWLQGMPCVDTKKFQPYVVKIHDTVQESHFWRPLTQHQEIFAGPLVLIHRSSCEAAFFTGDKVAYRDKITGIAGQIGEEQLLKWIVVYINSTLARYYHFLTSTSWAVERGTILHGEYKHMPLIVPDKDDPRLQKALTLFEGIVLLYQKRDEPLGGKYDADIERAKERIDELVFDIYDVVPMERQLIRDMVDYEIKFFEWSKRKKRSMDDEKARPVRPPENQMLIEYAQAFIEVATSLLHYQNQTLNAVVYQDHAPLNVVEFELVNMADARNVRFVDESKELHDLLYKLDRRLWERQASTIYTRRHVRIYDGLRFYVVRPSERRLWTRSQAYADADSFIAEVLSRSKRAAAGAVH